MKDQQTKKSKKKIALYYVILAVCLLVIAAITVTVVFTVNQNQPDISIDNGDNNDNKKPDDGKNPVTPPDDNKPTAGDYEFRVPVTESKVSVTSAHKEFRHDATMNYFREHLGLDFAGEVGDQVYAVLDGKISKIVTGDVLEGNYIVIEHANGVTSTYKFINVKEGLTVGTSIKKSDVLGTIAEPAGKELKQGAHLHFEMSANGKICDPEQYLDIDQK